MAKKKEVEIVTLGDEQVQVTEVEDKVNTEISELERPIITSPLWHDYVMMKFDESEVDNNGYPKVSGLRRLTEELIGTIIGSEAYPISDSRDRCSVKFVVNILDAESDREKIYGDVADATSENVGGDENISKHLLATASTRAEARVLRKILKLRVLSSEEAQLVRNPDGSQKDVTNETGFIQPSQITYLTIMCKRHNIDLWKFVNSGQNKYTCVEKIPYKNAQEMLRYLSKVQVGRAEVPKDQKGYNAEWHKQGGIS